MKKIQAVYEGSIDLSSQVKKSNLFIFQKSGCSLRELKFLSVVGACLYECWYEYLSKLDEYKNIDTDKILNGNINDIVDLLDSQNFQRISIKIKLISKLLNVTGNHIYTELPDISRKLMSRVFELRYYDKKGKLRIKQSPFLSDVDYKYGEGRQEIAISPLMILVLVAFSKKYTLYDIDNIYRLNSKYSFILFEILKSQEYKKDSEFCIDIDELKERLDVSETERWDNFKRRILDNSKKELEEKTDIIFEYRTEKEKRKTKKIYFSIKRNPKKIQQQLFIDGESSFTDIKLEYGDIIVKKLLDFGVKFSEIQNYQNKGYSEERIKNQIILLEEKIKNNTIKEITPWLRSAIIKDYFSTSTKGIKKKIEHKENILNEEKEKKIYKIRLLKKEYQSIVKHKIEEYLNNNSRKSILFDICNSHTAETSAIKKHCQQALDNNDIDSMFDEKTKFLPFIRPYIETKIDIINYLDFLEQNNINEDELFLKTNGLMY